MSHSPRALTSAKAVLALARLIRAAKLFENPGLSVASVANYLDILHRRVLDVMFGNDAYVPVEFRERYDGAGMLLYFREQLVLPYLGALRAFRPAAATPG